MNVIKKTRKIHSTRIQIDELKDYIGAVVDIMILPHKAKVPSDKQKIASYAGLLPSIADPLELQKRMRDEWSVGRNS
jgi:hypothetical protein